MAAGPHLQAALAPQREKFPRSTLVRLIVACAIEHLGARPDEAKLKRDKGEQRERRMKFIGNKKKKDQPEGTHQSKNAANDSASRQICRQPHRLL